MGAKLINKTDIGKKIKKEIVVKSKWQKTNKKL